MLVLLGNTNYNNFINGNSIAKIDASINKTNSIFEKNESTTRYLYDCFTTQGIEVSLEKKLMLAEMLEDAR